MNPEKCWCCHKVVDTYFNLDDLEKDGKTETIWVCKECMELHLIWQKDQVRKQFDGGLLQ